MVILVVMEDVFDGYLGQSRVNECVAQEETDCGVICVCVCVCMCVSVCVESCTVCIK